MADPQNVVAVLTIKADDQTAAGFGSLNARLAATNDALKGTAASFDRLSLAERGVTGGATALAASMGVANAETAAAGRTAAATASEWTLLGDTTRVAAQGLNGYNSAIILSRGNLALLGAVVGIEAVMQFGKFQQAIQQTAANAGQSTLQMDYMRTKVLQLGQEFPSNLEDIALAWRHVSDEGYRNAAALTVVSAAEEASTATGGKASDVANTLSVAMADFHEPASMAIKDMGMLLTASQQGNESLEQLVSGMSKLDAIAGAIHMPLQDVATLEATLSRALGSPALAQTAALNLVQHMIAPTAQALTLMKQLQQTTGVDLTTAFEKFANGQLSFKQVMEDVGKATNGNATYIDTLFGKIRGGTGALVLLNTMWQDYLTISKKVGDGSSQLSEQWSAATKTLAYQFGLAKNNAEELLIALGQDLGPALKILGDDFGPPIKAIEAFVENNPQFISGVAQDATRVAEFALVLKGLEIVGLKDALLGIAADIGLIGTRAAVAAPEVAALAAAGGATAAGVAGGATAGSTAAYTGSGSAATYYNRLQASGESTVGGSGFGAAATGLSAVLVLWNAVSTAGSRATTIEQAHNAVIKTTNDLVNEGVPKWLALKDAQAHYTETVNANTLGDQGLVTLDAAVTSGLDKRTAALIKAHAAQIALNQAVANAPTPQDLLKIAWQINAPNKAQPSSLMSGADAQKFYAGQSTAETNAAYKLIYDEQNRGTLSAKAWREEIDKDRAALDAQQKKVELSTAAFDKLQAPLDAANKAAKADADTYTQRTNDLATAQKAARDEFLKTGQILPSTRAEILKLTGQISGADKAIAALTPPTDALAGEQAKLQKATSAAYNDFSKYGTILPKHQAEITKDTEKIAAMQQAVAKVTVALANAQWAKFGPQELSQTSAIGLLQRQNQIADNQYGLTSEQKAVIDAQYALQEAQHQVALDQLKLDEVRHTPGHTAQQVAEAKAQIATDQGGVGVAQSNLSAAQRAAAAVDQWAAKLQLAQTAVTTATDAYNYDKYVLDEHGVALVTAKRRMDDANDALNKMTKQAALTTWALTQIANAGKIQPVGNADIPGFYQNQNLAGGGSAGSGSPASPQDNAAWFDAVFKKPINGTGFPFNPNGPSLLGNTVNSNRFGGFGGGGQFNLPSGVGSVNETAIQAGYTARQQAEQSIIDSLQHQSVLVGQDTSLTADQRKIDQDILQIKEDRKQTQIDLAKLEALQASGTATPDQIAAAKEQVTKDRNKTTEDTGQLSADKTTAANNQLTAYLAAFTTAQQNLDTIAQDQLAITTDKGNLTVQKLTAAVTAIDDQTGIIKATSDVAAAKASAQTTLVTDQTGIMAASYKAFSDSVVAQRTIDTDLRNGDTAKAALDRQIATAQQQVDRDGIAIARATYQRDSEVGQEQIQIANDALQLANDKASADAAAAAEQTKLLGDQLALDNAKLQLQLAQNQLTTDTNTILNATLVKDGGPDFSGQISNDALNVSVWGKMVTNLQGILGADQTNAAITAASYAKAEANDNQKTAIDSALLAATQGNWAQAIAILQQTQETDSQGLSTAQDSLNALQDLRQTAVQALQVQDLTMQRQNITLDYQKNMIDANTSLTSAEKDYQKTSLDIQEDNLTLQEDQIKLQEVMAQGGDQTALLQAQNQILTDTYKLNVDQYTLGQETLAATQDANSIAALEQVIATLRALLYGKNTTGRAPVFAGGSSAAQFNAIARQTTVSPRK